MGRRLLTFAVRMIGEGRVGRLGRVVEVGTLRWVSWLAGIVALDSRLFVVVVALLEHTLVRAADPSPSFLSFAVFGVLFASSPWIKKRTGC